MPKIPTGGPTAFGYSGAVITPGASDLPLNVKAIVCLSPGDVTIVPFNNADGATITFSGCQVGFCPPYVVRRVTAATGSWATVAD